MVDGLATRILACASIDENTGAPRSDDSTSITMNGFIAITLSASARCEASSVPDAPTIVMTGLRPHSWYVP